MNVRNNSAGRPVTAFVWI